ncbi:hypothetical protein [Nereida sp. MMG025]|uniref:hypothetical protein n=1 Tax=Nereida sp. MMG025 TaxID=2909981 RepID=UPI001F23B7A5|nr:hypothetical protein [Nereida sp. MMG025]MCF6445690.1 hypothetical protein [Nereida sp. MMG025]
MTDKADIAFWHSHPSVKRMGGKVRFLDKTLNDPHEQLLIEVCAGCQHLLRVHPARSILGSFDFLIIDSGVRNAAALGQDDKCAVVLSSGLVSAVSEIVRRLICGSSLLCQNFGREPRSAAFLWAEDPSTFMSSSNEREQRYFLNCLGRALEFVTLHELSHHLRDHASSLRNHDDSFLFEEVLWLNEVNDQRAQKLRHHCEIDADTFALRLSQLAALHGEERRPADHDLKEYWSSEIVIQCVALVSVFLALEDQSRRTRVNYQGPYPPLLHRAIIACDAVQHYYTKRGELDDDEEAGYVSQIWIDLEETCQDLAIPKGTWVNPSDEEIALELMNNRLAGFRHFQDQLDKRMELRMKDLSENQR